MMRNKMLPRLLPGAIAGLISMAVVADGFDLQINDVSGLDASWPLVAGLPFPEGALRDSSEIRIVNADGEDMPAQVDVAASWRDGSVRWALAGFTASPRGHYRVEYGDGITRTAPSRPLTVAQAHDGLLTVDTAAAVYTFRPDQLLPDRMVMGKTIVLDRAGAGAYLVDNQGRTGRVAGAAAAVESKVVLAGPARAVIRRAGWYVTESGDRLARAEAWFYLAAGSPYLKITQSLVLTEDTNEVWIRDYGLEFRTPQAPTRAVFALGEPGHEVFCDADPSAGERFMLQETFPHFLEKESRAVVTGIHNGQRTEIGVTNVAGDWADASFGDYGLTVVMPWLAQQFPKEIAFGPNGAKAAFWSGRCGRELDFRARTLVNEYWGKWAAVLVKNADSNVVPWINRYWKEDRPPEGAEGLAQWPSNARGAARTHDVWLLPHAAGEHPPLTARRAMAAARPPLVLADPAWLCATEAVGWRMHPKDMQRFAREEGVLSNYWDGLMVQFDTLPRTGFITWGSQPYLTTGKMFRQGILADYGLRRSVWGLYARSGERRYYDYGKKFNRHIADWWVTHWTAGNKFRGGFASPGGYWEGHLPFIWGDRSTLDGDSSGHDVLNWLLDYYLTGDEHAMDVTRMIGDTIKEKWDADRVRQAPTGPGGLERWEIAMPLRVLAVLYTREWDEDFAGMARDLSCHLMDPESPNGLTGMMSGGPLYKWERNVHALYEYYRATGDPAARAAILKALDYKYRFGFVQVPFSSTNHGAFLFAAAYRWTSNTNYLRMAKALVEAGVTAGRLPTAPHTSTHTTMGLPAAMALLAEVDAPIAPFPVLEYTQDDRPRAVPFEKAAGLPVAMRIYAELCKQADVTNAIAVRVAGADGKTFESIRVKEERVFVTPRGNQFPRKRHLQLTVPADVPAGPYTLTLPNAVRVRILESDAELKTEQQQSAPSSPSNDNDPAGE